MDQEKGSDQLGVRVQYNLNRALSTGNVIARILTRVRNFLIPYIFCFSQYKGMRRRIDIFNLRPVKILQNQKYGVAKLLISSVLSFGQILKSYRFCIWLIANNLPRCKICCFFRGMQGIVLHVLDVSPES